MTSAAQEELICGLHEFQKITGIKVSLNEETASMSLTSFKSIMPLLLYVSTKGRAVSETTDEAVEDQETDNLENCTRYIKEHIEEPLSLQIIADYCGYNPEYLSRKFKKIYGKNMSAYIKEVKKSVAANYLKNSNKALCDISETLCFATQSHFQNAFKAVYHMTPLEYRKRNFQMEVAVNE